MKSQDILVLFKLITLRQGAAQRRGFRLLAESTPTPRDWQGWEDSDDDGAVVLEDGIDGELDRALTVRGLEASLRLSKSEISHSPRRSMATGLATRSRTDGLPQANIKVLFLFVLHGLKYVDPASPAAAMRGIPIGFSAPVLRDANAVAGGAHPSFEYALTGNLSDPGRADLVWERWERIVHDNLQPTNAR